MRDIESSSEIWVLEPLQIMANFDNVAILKGKVEDLWSLRRSDIVRLQLTQSQAENTGMQQWKVSKFPNSCWQLFAPNNWHWHMMGDSMTTIGNCSPGDITGIMWIWLCRSLDSTCHTWLLHIINAFLF